MWPASVARVQDHAAGHRCGGSHLAQASEAAVSSSLRNDAASLAEKIFKNVYKYKHICMHIYIYVAESLWHSLSHFTGEINTRFAKK